MRKLVLLSVATFLAIALFVAGPLSAQDEMLEKMLEPIPDETIKALLTKYPNDARMHLGAAFLLTEDKNKAQAKDRAIKLAPEYKKIFLIQDLKGVYYKRFAEEDLRRIEELVEIDPGNAWPHYLLAGYYLEKGEKEKWLKEVNEMLFKERIDNYEVERLRAIFRLIDEVNPPFRALKKLHYWSNIALHELGAARASARELVRIGKEFEEKGEGVRALEYYSKAELIAQQLLLKKPDFIITRLVSVAIRKIAYPEMARFYEEEARVMEAAALREQLELMNGWNQELKRIVRESVESDLIFLQDIQIEPFDLDEIRPEKREEIKKKHEQLKNRLWDLYGSALYSEVVEAFLQRQLSEGEIEALKALPDPETSPIAGHLKRAEKEREELRRAIDQSLLPYAESLKICRSNLKRIGLACIMYADDHNGVFPPNLEVLGEEGYIKKEGFPKLMKCPAQEEDVGYIYIGAGKSTKEVKNQSRTIIAYDKNPAHDNGRNAVFMDGHAEWMPEERFQKLLSEQEK
jgi:prepilin-type processing-associated H-X9-DG protein